MTDAAALSAFPGPYIAAFGAALTCFVALWPWSVRRQDASLVDLVWGPGFLLQCAVAALLMPAIGVHGWLLLALVGLWSLRLAFTLTRRRWREGHEDPRYTAIRASWGATFWWKSLFIVFALQAFLQWAISVGPISGIATGLGSLGVVAVAGAALALAGIVLETLADYQLDRFKQTAAPGALLTSGLRAHVRHPNYTGEIVFWCGVALVVVDAGSWLGIISPLLITLFLWKVSGVPILDEHLEATRPGYAAYRKAVPTFLPSVSGRPGTRASNRPR